MRSRKLGFGIVELMVCIAIIILTATITLVVMNGAKKSTQEIGCMSRLNNIVTALAMYRADWGNANAVVGSGVYLGFPFALSDMSPPYVEPGSDRQQLEKISCPLKFRNDTYSTFGLYPSLPYENGLNGRISYEEATSVMHGDTPVTVDIFHNPASDDFTSPRVRRRILMLNLAGNVTNKMITGLSAHRPGMGFWLEEFVKIYDIKAWQELTQ